MGLYTQDRGDRMISPVKRGHRVQIAWVERRDKINYPSGRGWRYDRAALRPLSLKRHFMKSTPDAITKAQAFAIVTGQAWVMTP